MAGLAITPIISDNFSGSDGVITGRVATTGQTWSTPAPYSASHSIVSNVLTVPTAGEYVNLIDDAALTRNVHIQVALTSDPTNFDTMILWSASDGTDPLGFELGVNSSGVPYAVVYERASGSWQTIQGTGGITGFLARSTAYTIDLLLGGEEFWIFVDALLKLHVQIPRAGAYANHTAGHKVGIRSNAQAGTTFTSFKAANL